MKPRLMAKENFPMPSVTLLRDAKYDVLAIAEAHKSIKDEDVLSFAVAEERWIVTFDGDYGDLIFVKNLPAPPALLYLRLRSYQPEEPGYMLLELLRDASSFAGQFVVIQEDNLRKRLLPQR